MNGIKQDQRNLWFQARCKDQTFLDHRSQISDYLGSQITDIKSQIILDLKSQIKYLPQIKDQQPQISDHRSKITYLKPQMTDLKSQNSSQITELRSETTDLRSQITDRIIWWESDDAQISKKSRKHLPSLLKINLHSQSSCFAPT